MSGVALGIAVAAVRTILYESDDAGMVAEVALGRFPDARLVGYEFDFWLGRDATVIDNVDSLFERTGT